MRPQQILQIGVALLAAGTPWIVSRIAQAVASAHARSVGVRLDLPPELRRLAHATLIALPVVVLAAWMLPPPSLVMGAVDVTAFVVLSLIAWPALHEIDRASRPARDVASAERVASLRPRRPRQYLPLAWRVVPWAITGIGVILLSWRLISANTDRVFVPIVFILSAPVFVWLYEVWIRAEVSGGEVVGADESAADENRRRRVRRIFAVEIALAVILVSAGHTLLGLSWTADVGLVTFATVTGAFAGVVGCALALSSDLTRRRYRAT